MGDIRERLARLENLPTEMQGVRTRVHEMAQVLGVLQADSEDAQGSRKELSTKIDRLAESVGAATLANATVTATLGATLAAHVRQCEVDKQGIADTIVQSRAERREMHEANQKGLEGLRRLVFIGVGGVLALGFSVGVALNFLHH